MHANHIKLRATQQDVFKQYQIYTNQESEGNTYKWMIEVDGPLALPSGLFVAKHEINPCG